jgi:hypothetical protein
VELEVLLPLLLSAFFGYLVDSSYLSIYCHFISFVLYIYKVSEVSFILVHRPSPTVTVVLLYKGWGQLASIEESFD